MSSWKYMSKESCDPETLTCLINGHIWCFPPAFQPWIRIWPLILVTEIHIPGPTGREGNQQRRAPQLITPQWKPDWNSLNDLHVSLFQPFFLSSFLFYFSWLLSFRYQLKPVGYIYAFFNSIISDPQTWPQSAIIWGDLKIYWGQNFITDLLIWLLWGTALGGFDQYPWYF